MPFPLPRAVRRMAVALLAAAVSPLHAQTAPLPPLASFFNVARVDQAALSPDGKLLAMIVTGSGQREELAVVELDSAKVHAAAKFDNIDVHRFQWVNDKRLAFDTIDYDVGVEHSYFNPGLYAANFDGSDKLQLGDRYWETGLDGRVASARRHILPGDTRLAHDLGAQKSSAVHVTSPKNAGKSTVHDLLLLDTLTGKWDKIDSPDGTRTWAIDNQGALRMTVTLVDNKVSVYYREAGASAWKELPGFAALTDMRDVALPPLAFGPPGTLYLAARNGKDRTAVYAYDVASATFGAQPLISTDYDFDGQFIMSGDKLLGFRVTTDADSTVWLDPAMKALQEEIDQRMDSTVNLLSVPTRATTPWVLVESYSDVRPKSYAVYNRVTKAISKIGDSVPDIVPAQMGRQEMVHYKGRDGLDIPALLTMPANGMRTQLPLVVLVHGGPWVRGNAWGWKAESQFLASRGYAVLEPFYRGSTGFGMRHYRAGWKQWGLAMQDDLADGAKWAIAQGLADAKRICIAGGDYGGYATLMGLAKDPQLFKCGVDWSGITDLAQLYPSTFKKYHFLMERQRTIHLPAMLGDEVRDAAQLAATSPINVAARIGQPLLMAHGGADGYVPEYDANAMFGAVRKHNPKAQWVLYKNEGHSWKTAQTRIDFWRRVEAFLKANIGQ
jgi:dipeptidyl aminopeptidase/acylaminoacyl peptidase